MFLWIFLFHNLDYSAHFAVFLVIYRRLNVDADNINPYYQKLFETGVDEMSWDDMDCMQVGFTPFQVPLSSHVRHYKSMAFTTKPCTPFAHSHFPLVG